MWWRERGHLASTPAKRPGSDRPPRKPTRKPSFRHLFNEARMDATKRCATCKHWDKYKGVVASWDNPDDVGLCWLAVHEAPERIKEGRKMAARDMEDYWACLETRADFGCVCWEKPTTDH